MAEPHLSSLVIEGFRGFKKLELRKLGHVNLLVGKNGVGKSSVLDAVRLYSAQADFTVFAALLHERDETWNPSDLSCLSSLFHGRPDLSKGTVSLRVGPMRLTSTRTEQVLADDGTIRYRFFADEERWSERIPTLAVEQGTGLPIRYVPYGAFSTLNYIEVPKRPRNPQYEFLPARGFIQGETLAALWDRVELTRFQPLVEDAVRVVHEAVERIAFESSGFRRPRVKLSSEERPIAFRTMGDGAIRTLEIFLALVAAKDGFLLIDEFENGLHYSVQARIWGHLIRLARELNVQVIATTHSSDCVEAFGRAAIEDANSDGLVSRLVEVDGEITVAQYEERLLKVVNREMVEIR